MEIQANPQMQQQTNIANLIPGAYPNEVFLYVNYNNQIFSNYAISDHGRVYSFSSNKFLTLTPDKDGYLRTTLINGKMRKTVRINRIELMTFYPIMYPEKYVSNHKDGDKSNNMLYNLEWATNQDNTRHGWDTGLNQNKGEGNVRTYLSDNDIHFICKNLENGLKPSQICDLMGINEKGNRMRIGSIISGIVKGKSYRHISCNYNIPGLQGRTRYSLDFAHLVCQFLKNGDQFTYLEIMNALQIPKEDRKMFKVYINDLLRGRTALEVTRYYGELKKPKEDKIDDFYC